MYIALYRRFRPETFNSVLGQDHIVKILKNQLREGSTTHAYLFTGTRGTGKTTVARLLAKGLNCTSEFERPCGKCENCVAIKDGTFVDVIEIDAASNNGVENIRELRESVKYPPSKGSYKVYIIDEVHMLSSGAFNALLKTLEEPPENVVFILATTEPQKLPATILSRCLRLDFKRVSNDTLIKGMKEIAGEINASVTADALALLASNADGSVRDALSLLDQVVAGSEEVTRDSVLELLGAVGDESLYELTGLLVKKDVTSALLKLNEILEAGKEERQLMRDWIEYYRSLLLVKCMQNPERVLNMSPEAIEKLGMIAERISVEEINECIATLAKYLNDARLMTYPRILLELFIVQRGEQNG